MFNFITFFFFSLYENDDCFLMMIINDFRINCNNDMCRRICRFNVLSFIDKIYIEFKIFFFSLHSHLFSLRKAFVIIRFFLIIRNQLSSIQISRIIILILNVKTIKKRLYRLIA